MQVKDFMITDVIYVTKEMNLKQLLQTLVRHKIGGVPVIGEQGKLLGVISDGDVLRYLKPQGTTVYDMFSLVLISEKEDIVEKLTRSLKVPVEKLMKRRDIQTLYADDDIETALQLFAKYHFKKIPIIDTNHHVIGIISRGDIIRYMTQKLIEESQS
ncbi:HPP family protein [Virgibacillus soli]|uniref:CBS domain-containing protein n=1 Tax=Paracerasibacillus soli TaxID=480284 RepID=A0ABU5CPF9_9BACI|nr:CBS domain-containing protein [Virgibacillus soli]MDY0408243.1 CBS domain-containing protein [Virgibacillus soli]